MVEPVVRIRCPSPEEEGRARALLEAAGWRPERSLTWLVVREADPDAVNEALVAGGAAARVAVREQLGRLLAWLLDRQGDLRGREVNVRNLCARVLSEGGLSGRHALKDEGALVEAAQDLTEQLLATGAAFVPWGRFLSLFCRVVVPGG
ncbi:MAG TPA: hypothetical protein VFF02_04380 [Anaeromyxobacteraceae bacterium]|nr:hypothetical protein [Anaeromyxobacteraceae bacterium]